ncbi:metal-dependent transcriptional regulator [Actinomyces sp. oral taxon 414]|uniref:metal-dependent transcriptional regulator n=1 Tax=Actinomyces sp. oral taxon 414 TaxID=712122 RepID=UPI0009F91A6C|nr:metal-dependent transcriptional regulator [Actinomyces sp. oral taxon 414]
MSRDERGGAGATGGARATTTGEAHDVDSTVTQDYLKAVWAACEWGGAGASITGLARRMGVAASTASENVARLVEAGLLEHEPYRAVTLSEEGDRRARRMMRRHRLLETYLVEVLGFEWDEVHAEAEVLEHACSDRLLAALDAALGHPVRDPHGDPIPAADGRIIQPALRSIDAVGVGRTVVVGRIRDESALLRDLRRAGIGLDTPVRVVARGSAPASGASRSRRTTTVRAVRPAGPAGLAGAAGSAGPAGPAGAGGSLAGAAGPVGPAGAADTAEVVVPAGTLWVLA